MKAFLACQIRIQPSHNNLGLAVMASSLPVIPNITTTTPLMLGSKVNDFVSYMYMYMYTLHSLASSLTLSLFAMCAGGGRGE